MTESSTFKTLPGLRPSSMQAAWCTWPRLWWLNVLLFCLTGVTTTVFGAALVTSFREGRPLSVDDIVTAFTRLIHHDAHLWVGLQFSVPLLMILLAHEMGHYVACVRYGVDATLPYFLPSPTMFGTLGAFIRIRTPIYRNVDLFDIGSAGPLAGFVMLLPFLVAGVWLSHPLAAGFRGSAILTATPLAVRGLEWLRFGAYGADRILLHPTATAALCGLLMTALNLLPMGQLDGGHITYALFGTRVHRNLATFAALVLVGLGFLYKPWWFWAALMFWLGRRHPLVFDDEPLPPSRRWLAVAAFIIFILAVSVVPTRL